MSSEVVKLWRSGTRVGRGIQFHHSLFNTADTIESCGGPGFWSELDPFSRYCRQTLVPGREDTPTDGDDYVKFFSDTEV